MIGAFFAWWFGQLRELLPASLFRPTSPDALVLTPEGPLDQPVALGAVLRRSGAETSVGRFIIASGELRDVPVPPGLPIALRLPECEFLQKTLTLPIAAQADLEKVLTFEMDQETPFTADELYWNHRVVSVDRARQQLVVHLWLLPRTTLAPLMAAVTSARSVPSWAEIVGAGEIQTALALDGGGKRQVRGSQRLLWAAAATCLLLAIGAAVTPFARQSLALGALEREVDAGRSAAMQAEALRREIDGLSRRVDLVNGEVRNAGRPVEVLAQLTSVLPDDTYLTEFELRSGKLTLSGRSAGAARLIGALAANGGFHNPAFAAPVTRLEALHAEVFTIAVDLVPAP